MEATQRAAGQTMLNFVRKSAEEGKKDISTTVTITSSGGSYESSHVHAKIIDNNLKTILKDPTAPGTQALFDEAVECFMKLSNAGGNVQLTTGDGQAIVFISDKNEVAVRPSDLKKPQKEGANFSAGENKRYDQTYNERTDVSRTDGAAVMDKGSADGIRRGAGLDSTPMKDKIADGVNAVRDGIKNIDINISLPKMTPDNGSSIVKNVGDFVGGRR
jgi:hypothetical protein